MFDLDRDVNAWCESVHASRCRAGASIEELKDHLYCEIERLQSEGHSAEQAFEQATARLGGIDALDREFDKNRSWFSRTCRSLGLVSDNLTQGLRKMRIANALLWAALIIATAIVARRSGGGTVADFQYLLIVVFIPLWFAADQLMLRAMKPRQRR